VAVLFEWYTKILTYNLNLVNSIFIIRSYIITMNLIQYPVKVQDSLDPVFKQYAKKLFFQKGY